MAPQVFYSGSKHLSGVPTVVMVNSGDGKQTYQDFCEVLLTFLSILSKASPHMLQNFSPDEIHDRICVWERQYACMGSENPISNRPNGGDADPQGSVETK